MLSAVRSLFCRIVVAALVLVVLVGRPVSAEAVETIPISKIRPGMKGYGLTVFFGFKIVRFQVEVIEVMKNFLPNQDLFLVRVDHPRLRTTGVLGGMSGSPIYLEGKLAGALAYGWRFSKEPIAGITPIKDMLDLLKRKERGPDKANVARHDGVNRPLSRAAVARISRARRFSPLLGRQPLPLAEGQLTPVAVPLSVAGFTPQTMGLLRDGFARYGFEPVQGGGTGKAEGPSQFSPGSALGFQLVRGDMSMTSTGTATWTDRSGKVLGYGHPMFNAGEIHLPAVTAKIVHTLASLNRSFKISNPARPAGRLLQDRQAGVLVDSTRPIDTIPMKVTIEHGKTKRVFSVHMARHRVLTANATRMVVQNAVKVALSDMARATVTVRTRIALRGHKPVRIEEHLYSDAGAQSPLAYRSKGVKAVAKILQNPFELAHIERIDVAAKVVFGREVVEITDVKVAQNRVEPGARISVGVTFKPFSGPRYTKWYPLDIPGDLDGGVLSLSVSSGDKVRPDTATPTTFGQWLAVMQKSYSARSLVLSLSLPGQGLKLQGKVVRDLPTSVVDALSAGTSAGAISTFNTVRRTVHRTQPLVSGRQTLRLRVIRESS